jgi:type I restriction enzyme, S subunit
LDSRRRPIKASERISGPFPYYGASGQIDSINSYLFDEKLVLVAEDGGFFYDPIRPIAYVVEGKCWVNNHAHVLRVSDRILEEFLYYYIGFSDVTAYLSGSTRPKLTKSDLARIPTVCPPLKEQRLILDILSRAEGIVRLRREAQKKADELIPALFLEMFGDPATNPKGWPMVTLLESGASIRYGIGQPLPNRDDGLPFIRATNIKRGKIVRDGLIFIDAKANPTKRNPPLHRSDIIVVRSGAYTGDVAQVGEDFEGAIAGYDLVMRPGEHHLAVFLATYLLLPYVQDGYIRKHKTRAAQPHLNATQLGSIKVPIPPIKLQSIFEECMATIRSIQNKQTIGEQLSETAFEALLSSIFKRC